MLGFLLLVKIKVHNVISVYNSETKDSFCV